jgi:hypothetical protein
MCLINEWMGGWMGAFLSIFQFVSTNYKIILSLRNFVLVPYQGLATATDGHFYSL